MVLGFMVAPLPPRALGSEVWVAAIVNLAIVAVIAAAPWRRLPPGMQALPPLAYLVVVALLREAEGGAASGASSLVLLPIFWLAMYGNRWELAMALVGTAAIFVLPVALIGGDRYPTTDWERAVLWTSAGSIVGYTVQDLVQRISTQAAELAELSRTDPLLGLPNRRAWQSALARELARAERDGRPLSVAMLDLDGFKRFNDAHGHQAGDHLLREIGGRWRGALRETDVLARYGGDEFGAVLPDATVEAAAAMVERLRRSLPDGQACSAGIARWDRRESAESLVERADAALYRAKAAGGGRTIVAA